MINDLSCSLTDAETAGNVNDAQVCLIYLLKYLIININTFICYHVSPIMFHTHIDKIKLLLMCHSLQIYWMVVQVLYGMYAKHI